MDEKRENIVLVCADEASARIDLHGKLLLRFALEAAQSANIGLVRVCTESAHVADIAKSAGAEVVKNCVTDPVCQIRNTVKKLCAIDDRKNIISLSSLSLGTNKLKLLTIIIAITKNTILRENIWSAISLNSTRPEDISRTPIGVMPLFRKILKCLTNALHRAIRANPSTPTILAIYTDAKIEMLLFTTWLAINQEKFPKTRLL